MPDDLGGSFADSLYEPQLRLKRPIAYPPNAEGEAQLPYLPPVDTSPSLKSYQPGVAENLGALAQQGLTAAGMRPEAAQHFGSRLKDALGWSNVVGLSEVPHDISTGDYLGAGLNLAGAAIPGAAKGAKAIRGVVKEAAKEAVPTGEALARSIVDEGLGRTGRAPAITTTTQLRNMPLDQAIATARTNPHIIVQNDGTWVGAPLTVRSQDDLNNMRTSFDQAVGLGQSVGGDQWYQKGRDLVSSLTGGDRDTGRLLAQELGVTSPQATPETNLGFALQGHNAYEAGQPLDIMRTGQIARTYNTAREAGTDIPLGKKTSIYGINLDPNLPWTTTGTNDIWHARALGYTHADGRPWDAALSPQQHAFMDAETVLAVDRANQAKLGGRGDWTAPEIQAAAWVGRKAQALAAEKKIPIEEALRQSAKGYPEALPKYTAYGTTDPIPGVGTGHRPDISEGTPEARAAYGADPRSTFAPQGRDVYHEALGLYQQPTVPTTGVFQSAGGPLEVNPGEAARPMVGRVGESGERTWDPNSEQLVRGAEAAKGYVSAQNMAAANLLTPTNKAGRMGSVQFNPGGQWSPEQVQALSALGGQHGLPDVMHMGDVGVMTNFGGAEPKATAKALGTEEKPGGLATQLAGMIPGAKPRRTELTSSVVDYQPAWQQGPGSGAVTRQLRENLTPAIIAKLDASDAVRKDVLGRMQRDMEGAEQGATVRQDLQNARDIINKEGFSGLFKALDAGKVALPAAAIGAYLAPHLTQQEQPNG